MEIIGHDIIHLLKTATLEEIEMYYADEQIGDFDNFSSYIKSLSIHINKVEISSLTNVTVKDITDFIDGDYVPSSYDTTLAILIAAGLNYCQVQNALRLLNFEPLVFVNAADRLNVVIIGLREKAGFKQINKWLNLCGYADLNGKHEIAKLDEIIILQTELKTAKTGIAPLDMKYFGEIKAQQNGEIRYIYALYDTDSRYVVSKTPYEVKDEPLESYDSLKEADDSAFFELFLRLDCLTDYKCLAELNHLNDTKNFNFRFGSGWYANGYATFIETFDPFHRNSNEYLQLLLTENGYRYSLSNASYYMRYSLDDLYGIIYNIDDGPHYIFKHRHFEKVPEEYISQFNKMKEMLSQYNKARGVSEHNII